MVSHPQIAVPQSWKRQLITVSDKGTFASHLTATWQYRKSHLLMEIG
jgi:hypothetical protein